jgi:hypothetical protein
MKERQTHISSMRLRNQEEDEQKESDPSA